MAELLYDPESVPERGLEKLKKFEELLTKWNQNMNIVSPKDIPLIWTRHILDSLQMIPFLKGANKLADMGAGIGFPSIPIAIACPEINIFAIEPHNKKVSLFTQLLRELGIPNIHVLPEKVETVIVSHMDIVCCRAFGEFMRDSQLAYKMLKPGGKFITFKADPETRVPSGFDKVTNHEYLLPNYAREFNIVVTQKLSEFD